MKMKLIFHLTILQSLRNICECSSSMSTNERHKSGQWSMEEKGNHDKEGAK